MRVVGNAIRNLYGQISITSPSTGNSSLQLNSTTYNWNSTGLGAIDAGIVGGFTGATSSSAWWMNAYVDPTQTLRYKTSGLIALENVADTTGWHWNSAVAGTAGASFAFNTVATLSQFGNFTAGPTTGIAIQGNGTANAYAISAVGNSTSGQSFGMNVLAGTTSADIAFAVLNQAASLNYVRVFGDGGVVVANPAGGDKGIGTINATGLFINNAAVTAGTGAGTTIAGTANQIAVSAATGAVTLSIPQNVIIPTPASGIALAVTGGAGGSAVISAITTAAATAFAANGPAATQLVALLVNQNSQTNWLIYQPGSSSDLRFFAGSDRAVFTANGNVTFPAPASGVALTVTGVAGSSAAQFLTTGVQIGAPTGGDKGSGTLNVASGLFINNVAVTAGTGAGTTIAGTANQIAASASTGAVTLSFAANGVIMPAPSSGVSLTVTGFNGTHSTKIADSATNSFNAGFLEIPQNSQSAAYTTVRSDSGKHIYHPSADTTARTWTIDSNANVPYPIGTAITFDNDTGAGVITLAITTDTLVWLPSGSTGSRTIAANGQGTALKVTATRWHLTGVGIT